MTDIKIDGTKVDNSQEAVFPGEPEGGWVTAPTLLTNEILTLILCKYSGERPIEVQQCQARMLGRHADENCLSFYHSAAGLRAGTVEVDDDLMLSEQITLGEGGNEPTYKDPVE